MFREEVEEGDKVPQFEDASNEFLAASGHHYDAAGPSPSFGDSQFADAEVYRSMMIGDHDDMAEYEQQPAFKSVQLDYGPTSHSLGSAAHLGSLPPLNSLDPKTQPSHHHNWHSSFDQLSIQPKNLEDAVVLVGAGPKQQPQPPAAPGGFLEPNYHEMSRSPAGDLFKALKQILDIIAQERQLDYVVDTDKFKYNCVTYPGSGKLAFTARLFSTDIAGETAIEFQRRSGCIMAFTGLYREAKQMLQELGHLACDVDDVTSKSAVFGQLPELPDLDFEVTEDQTRETVTCLLNMATSTFTDVQVQGIMALTQLTREKESQHVLVDSAMDFFVSAISSTTECVHRCAVTGLANLAKDRADACKKLFERDGVAQLLELAVTEKSTPQVVRECARALANVAAHLKRQIVCEHFEQKMTRLDACNDRQTQSYVQELRKCVA